MQFGVLMCPCLLFCCYSNCCHTSFGPGNHVYLLVSKQLECNWTGYLVSGSSPNESSLGYMNNTNDSPWRSSEDWAGTDDARCLCKLQHLHGQWLPVAFKTATSRMHKIAGVYCIGLVQNLHWCWAASSRDQYLLMNKDWEGHVSLPTSVYPNSHYCRPPPRDLILLNRDHLKCKYKSKIPILTGWE